MKRQRTPVWLVTGFLGSGKTTLLRRWLAEPGLQDAALVVNEVGEVGFDDRLLAHAVDSAMLLSNQCVCCTGLQGLVEALTALWWDRLYRHRPHFSTVVIETTGLADPTPVVDAFASSEFMRDRYELAGVLTTVSTVGGAAVLSAHPEARAQVKAADVLVITKTDCAEIDELALALQTLHPQAGVIHSARASVAWQDILDLKITHDHRSALASRHAHEGTHVTHHPHGHHAVSRFEPMPGVWTREQVQHTLQKLLAGGALLRLKGCLQIKEEGACAVQWSLGHTQIEISPWVGEQPSPGLTLIMASQPAGVAG